MAGDAALGITPVMKWNFERSCYRWLVTRHPAQFERMDFTAQILQSASRARKAFYECGWAEAKVLIRPSDGKFERTPFFDTIIRRGLRNSTRFDASTLTEEEIEALGMHRDETLGFKLQIRQFRNSSRKELPPLGRGGGAGRLRSSTSSSAAPSADSDSDSKAGAGTCSIATPGASIATGSAGAIKIAMNSSRNSNSTTEGLLMAGRTSHSLAAVRASPSVGGDVGGGGGVRCGDARASPDESTHRVRAPGGWGGDGGRVPVSGLGWPDEAVWRCGNRATETSGRRDGWTPREHMGKWDFRSSVGSASNGQRDRYVDNNDDTRYPDNGVSTQMAMPPWAHPPVAVPPNGGSHHPWQSPQARAWSCVDGSERHYRSPMGIFGDRAGNGGDVKPCRPGSGEGDARDCRGGSDVPGGIPSKPLGRQTEADIRTSFPHQVGHLAKRPIGRAVAGPPRLSGGGEALNTPKPADGSLLTQGYLRLAAMNLGGEGGDDTRRAIVNNSVPHRYEAPASVISGAKSCAEDLSGRRPAKTHPVVHYARPGPPGYTSGVEDGPALKKRRSFDGVNARGSAVGGLPQPENSVERDRSNSDAGDIQPWPRGRRASSPPDPQGDLLARELVESERQLDLARHALDEAQTKFEEANRAHKAKRKQVFAAAATDKQSAERASSLERGTSRDPLARTCDGRNDRRGPSVAGRSSHDHPANFSKPRRASSPTPPNASTTVCADEMREVKREAALLYGIARAPMSSAGSPPRASASAPATTSSEDCSRTGSPAEPHKRALSQKAPNHAPEASSARRSPPSPPSPLPNLARAMPSGFGGAREVEEGRQPPARGLAPLGDDCRPGGNIRMRVGSLVNRGGARASVFPPPALAAHPSEVSAYAHRPIAPRGAMSQMYQAPGSPSVSGETDSEHSDSATGVGAAQDDAASHHQHRQQEHRDLQGHKQRGAVQSSGFGHAPSRGNQHWGARFVGGLLDGKGEASSGYVAPLARLAAVATAGAQ